MSVRWKERLKDRERKEEISLPRAKMMTDNKGPVVYLESIFFILIANNLRAT
jgi:hypothetical protein